MSCIKGTIVAFVVVVSLALVGGLLLYLYLDQPKNTVFSVVSSAVKAYNLTSDNRLFCIINLGVRARNPNHKKKHSLKFKGIAMEVRKGKHHALAADVLGSFQQEANNDTVFTVEAVGLRVDLMKKTAKELRADAVAGEGRVNVFLSGILKKESTVYDLGVNCKDVVVDFSRSTEKAQQVGCKVTVKSKSEWVIEDF